MKNELGVEWFIRIKMFQWGRGNENASLSESFSNFSLREEILPHKCRKIVCQLTPVN